MFEGIVADILTKILGKYVEDFNKEQLSIGIFGGNVSLKNLHLKGEALAELNLPITVIRGILGSLELQVPWKNLSSKPVVVKVDDIYILCGPQKTFYYSKEESEKQAEIAKQNKLANYELLKEMKQKEKDGGADKNAGFTAKLVEKIINNLQVSIGRIHFRYEDEISGSPGKYYAFGATLGGVSVLSTDEHWHHCFIEGLESALKYKLADLNSLTLYIDTDTRTYATMPTDQLCSELRRNVAFNDKQTGVQALPLDKQYILRPVNAQVRVILNMSPKIDMKVPKIQADLSFPAIDVTISEEQYHTSMYLVETLGKYSQAMKYVGHRPSESVKENPKAWLRYAGNVVLDDVRANRKKNSFPYLVEMVKKKERYIELFKRSRQVKWLKPLNDAEKKEIAKLEKDLTFEDIVL